MQFMTIDLELLDYETIKKQFNAIIGNFELKTSKKDTTIVH